MQKTAPTLGDQPPLWPIFSGTSNYRCFWDKLKKGGPDPKDLISLKGTFSRIGKKHTKPKAYFFVLDEHATLFYFKSQKEKFAKGKVQLNAMVQMRMEYLQLSKNEEAIALTFYRTETVKYQVFTQDTNLMFCWYEALRAICSINNYDAMYMATELLGKGSFASVYKVQRLLDDTEYAAKCYYIESFQTNPQKEKYVVVQSIDQQTMIKNEVECLRSLDHPGLLKLHEVFQQADKIVLITDLVKGVSLYELIKTSKRLPELQACVLLQNMAGAMASMASHGMAHRDLKLENIIVTSKVLLETVILDFGFAERINSQRLISKAGTPGYIAPEVFDGKPYTEKGDVFSLGVMYYSMVSGKSPFRGRDYREIMESNRQAQLSFSSFQGISEECQVLICQMMERDPAKRISFLDILSNEVPRSHQQQYLKRQCEEFRRLLFQQTNGNPQAAQARSQSGMYESFDFKQRGLQVKSFYKQSVNSQRSPQQQVQQAEDEVSEMSNECIPQEDGPQTMPVKPKIILKK